MAADAARGALAAVHRRRELRLLRGLGLALLLPARRIDRVELRLRRPHPRAPLAVRPEAAAHRGRRRERGASRVLQVLRLRRLVHEQPVRPRRGRPPARGALDRPARRHLVLHVHGDQLRRRRLPRRLPADVALEVRRVPLVLPAPRRGADRAARRARSAARDSTRPALRGHLARVLPHRHRSFHEGRDSELPGDEHRRPRLRRARPALVARGARRRVRVRRPDLRRLLRLHEHRHRDRPVARVPVPAELRRAVRGRVDPGLLATLAHDPVALAARLPLHPARREPGKPISRRTAT